MAADNLIESITKNVSKTIEENDVVIFTHQGNEYVLKYLKVGEYGVENPIEIDAGSRVLHPNILSVQYLVSKKDQQGKVQIGIIVPKYRWESKVYFISRLSFEVRLSFIYKIIRVVSMLHDANIIHIDIKKENLLIDNNEEPILIDFGSAHILSDGVYKSKYNMTTPTYMTPEVAGKDYNFTKATDIWCVGHLCIFILTNATLELQQREILNIDNVIDDRLKLHLKKWISREKNRFPLIKDLIKRMMRRKPEERESLKDLLDAPIFEMLDPVPKVEKLVFLDCGREPKPIPDMKEFVSSHVNFFQRHAPDVPCSALFRSVDLFYRSTSTLHIYITQHRDHRKLLHYISHVCMTLALSTVADNYDPRFKLFKLSKFFNRAQPYSPKYWKRIYSRVVCDGLRGVIVSPYIFESLSTLSELKEYLQTHLLEPDNYFNFEYKPRHRNYKGEVRDLFYH